MPRLAVFRCTRALAWCLAAWLPAVAMLPLAAHAATLAEKARESTASMREHGLELDMPSLIYHGERNNVMDYLTALGWRMTGVPRPDLFARHDVPLPELPDADDPLGEIVYVSGTLPTR